MDNIQKVCRNVKYLFDTTIIDPVQIKVREVTSSDPWGPAASDMSELAHLSYTKSPVIIPDLFMRLDEDNWRVVYKALVVLDYIIKYGSETVLVGCSRNLTRLMKLQNCRQDHGQNIREKSRQIIALVTDPVWLKLERAKARRIHERVPYRHSEFREFFHGVSPSFSIAERHSQLEDKVDKLCSPANSEEEAFQLQLAIAHSKEDEKFRTLARTEQPRLQEIDQAPLRRLILPDPELSALPVSTTAPKANDLIDLSEWFITSPQGEISLAIPTDNAFSFANSDLQSSAAGTGANLMQALQLSPTNPFAGDVRRAQTTDLEMLSKWFTTWLELYRTNLYSVGTTFLVQLT